MMLFLGIILYVFTVIGGENIVEQPVNLTSARSSRNARQQSLPVTLNLRDVVIGINILKMQKGEMLKIRPVFDKKYEIYSTNKTNQLDEIFEDDDCEYGNCEKKSNSDNLMDLFKNAIITNNLNEEDDSEEQKDEADINLVLGRTINLFSAPGLATTIDESSASYWKYVDQSQWSTRFPNCAGTRQSPIDFPSSVPSVTGTPCLKWVNYHSAQRYLTLNNDGHTVYASSTWAIGGIPTLSGGILTGTYRLAGIHWHWGRDNNDGAEHSMQSRKYPLEMHLVHFNTQYATVEAALASGNPEALAVVGVLFRASLFSNPGMTVITRAMRRATMLGTQDTVLPLGDLGLNFRDGYYTYQGSLTSPPCNQVVRWIVLKRVLHIRNSQLQVFRNVLVNGKPLVDTYRFVQPLNGRQIQFYEGCSG